MEEASSPSAAEERALFSERARTHSFAVPLERTSCVNLPSLPAQPAPSVGVLLPSRRLTAAAWEESGNHMQPTREQPPTEPYGRASVADTAGARILLPSLARCRHAESPLDLLPESEVARS